MRIPVPCRAALAAALLLGSASRGGAVDLTGTWVGTIKCKSTALGGTNAIRFDSTVEITQYPMPATFVDDLGVRIDGGLHRGKVVFNDAAKAISVISRCGGDANLGATTAMLEWEASVRGEKAKLKGTGVRFDASFDALDVCKYKYRRVDTVNASVPAPCP